MASLVPRERWDTRGATAWTSFLAELAVARRSSTQAAALVVADAQQLVGLMPRTLTLLEQGELVVARARALIDAARAADDDLVRRLDAEIADRACHLVPARIRAAVDRVALQHGVDVAAARSARAAAARGTRQTPMPDGQAELALVGPALVLAQARAALDADARTWLAALRGTGDARGLDQLRFDLGVHRLLAGHAQDVETCSVVVRGGVDGSGRDGEADRSGTGGPVAPAAVFEADSAPVDEGPVPAPPAAPTAPAPAPPGPTPAPPGPTLSGVVADDPRARSSLPDPTSPAWWTDRRYSRPVRLDIAVPVTTCLGLSDEPGWLPGYGWIAAPQVRQLLPVAELRQACVASEGPAVGQLVDVAEQVVRPTAGDPAAARAAVVSMSAEPFDITAKTWREEPGHDPSPALAEFVRLRDRHCDGPVGGRALAAAGLDLDHDKPYDGGAGGASWPPGGSVAWAVHGDVGFDLDPHNGLLTFVDLGHEDLLDLAPPDPAGPTAAWNLVGRGRRTHGLKHRGWTPLRTATSTLWFTPAGQSVEVPHALDLAAPVPAGGCCRTRRALHDAEAALLRYLGPVQSGLETDDEDDDGAGGASARPVLSSGAQVEGRRRPRPGTTSRRSETD